MKKNLDSPHWSERLEVLAIFGFFLIFLLQYFSPSEIFTSSPATGGDTGSHFAYAKLLREELWDKGFFQLRAWNPANLGGEPVFLHYFPLPYILMALLSYLIPIGSAFNFITAIGAIAIPFSTYAHLKLTNRKSTAALAASALSLFILFDESYSILGGNILSTLAGQFCFIIAINFWLLASGFFIKYFFIKKENKTLLGAIFFSALVSFSHAYIFITIPTMMFAILIVKRDKDTFWTLFFSGIAILLLTAWQLFPMIENRPHTVSLKFFFFIKSEMKKLTSVPAIIGWGSILLTFFVAFYKKSKIAVVYSLYFIFLLGLAYLYSAIELYPMRVLAPALYFAIVAGVYSLSQLFNFEQWIEKVLLLACITFCFTYTYQSTKSAKAWIRYNYSGWEKKPLYPNVSKVFDELKGSLSQPRVLYEHHPKLNGTGTTRVFESLGVFAKRATFESLFAEAHKFSAFAYLLQSYASDHASCPFGYKYKCDNLNMSKLHEKLDFLGGDSIVFIEEKAKKVIAKNENFKLEKEFKPFQIYKLKKSVNMVEVIEDNDLTYPKSFAHSYDIMRNNFRSISYNPVKTCHPKVEVSFSGLKLITDCPGKKHFLKYSYHSYLKSLSGEKIEKVFPYFMAIIPKSTQTTIVFSGSFISNITPYISLLTLFLLLFFARKKRFT